MRFHKLCHVFLYQDYLVFVSGENWEITCLKYYFSIKGMSPDQASAIDEVKAKIEEWIALNRK